MDNLGLACLAAYYINITIYDFVPMFYTSVPTYIVAILMGWTVINATLLLILLAFNIYKNILRFIVRPYEQMIINGTDRVIITAPWKTDSFNRSL